MKIKGKKKINRISKQPIWICAYFLDGDDANMHLRIFSSESKALFFVNFLCTQRYKITRAYVDEGITYLYKAFGLDINELQSVISQKESTKLN